jgi:hypothetical protein
MTPEGALWRELRRQWPLWREKLAGGAVLCAIAAVVSPPASFSRLKARFGSYHIQIALVGVRISQEGRFLQRRQGPPY